MSPGYLDRTLDNPLEDAPSKEPLELFVTALGRELPPNLSLYEMQIEIVRRLCHRFNLRPPISGIKIRTFLEIVGIYLDEAPNAHSTGFVYNKVMSRYEIRTRPCFHQEWSLEVWHEVWEVLFWRCFHKIKWWKQWALDEKINSPHDKADEFAFHLLLSPQSVPPQAKKRGYDVYEVAKHYGVPTNLAFRALNLYTAYEHPVLMALLRLNVPAPALSQSSVKINLFSDSDAASKMAHAQVWRKFFKKGKKWEDVYGLDVQEQQRRCDEGKSFKSLSEYLSRDNILSFEAIDPIYQYGCQPEPRDWTVPHVLGLDLRTDLSIITRQSPHNSNEIFLQIMPPKSKNAFLPSPMSALDVLMWDEQKKFQRAAQVIGNRSRSPVAY